MHIGVMSGTSMDAVDVAVVDFSEASPRLAASLHGRWPPALLGRVKTFAQGGPLDADDIARLDSEVGVFLAGLINQLLDKAGLTHTTIDAIGCHGQTVAHAPEASPPCTLQLGDANVIAERTGITTVNDFRRRDLAAGGQGAPLAPAFHARALSDPAESRVVLNLGGIANITYLPAGDHTPPIGFDTGPANCLMDAWTKEQRGQAYDDEGRWAATGTVIKPLLEALLDDPYFALAPPKSTGTQYFSRTWLEARLPATAGAPTRDVQATLLALTHDSIVSAIETNAPLCERVLVCGGGVHNTFLMQRLGKTLNRPVESTTRYGIDPDWVEAIAFAWLAKQTLAGDAGNLHSVTGAAGPRILGAIHPA